MSQDDDLLTLTVADYADAAEGVRLVVLEEQNGRDLPEWTPGAHIDLILPNGLIRQYSLSGDPADRSQWRIGVLNEPSGRGGSRYIHEELTRGQTLRARGPRNHFKLALAEGPADYLFIAGGIGITPLLPMLRAVQASGSTWRLLYGGRSSMSMAFLDELAEYGDRVSVWPQDERGLLPLVDEATALPTTTSIYYCGPEPLLAAIEQQFSGWPQEALHVERFKPLPVVESIDDSGDVPFEVVCEQAGVTLTIPVGRSILEVAEVARIPTFSSCREGTCGTCETTVLAGIPDHRDSVLSDQERATNETMMICVGRAKTPSLTLDL